MGLGPTAQPSLAHRWNSNREILNPTNQKVGGGGKVDHFSDLGREGGLVIKEWVFSLPHFGRQGACHNITKSADFQTNINFSKNDCKLQKFFKNVYQTNEFRLRVLGNKIVFEKTQIGWRQMLVASQLSRNKFLVIVVKIYTEADFKVSWYCPILLDFFTYFQIFCPGW